jgi:hypothetical protein
MRAIFPLAILLAACGKPALPDNQDNGVKAELLAPPGVKIPAPKPFVFDEKNDLIDLHFAWSSEAAAVPQLVKRFQAELDKAKAELSSDSKEEIERRKKEGFPVGVPFTQSTDYKTAGSTDRLLSLSVDIASYTGGAHGNYGTKGLLWDRWANKEIKVADLFAAAANMDRLLTQPWCDALNKAREEKRGETVGGGGMFDDCPKLTDISIIPTDKDGNGKFERLILVADPYVAGPYVEGSYEIELPVTGDLIAAIRSDYRENFEAQPQ